ncbi:PML-RARA-regulated adapter molecule 1 [Sorex araneus]|uniref:PML-RARA-regulated adapter molecule 1 n=1 Tax=Sorex araneus TaxID=42254 RepID=UPI002433A230|nr:PML-RARA-regulated adapter molecule 1 [Sorex araneus]
MGSPQDFRSLQAKFQARKPETSGLPKRASKPDINKLLKKFPPTELSEHPQKPPEFSVGPRKPPQPEFPALPKKPPQPEFPALPKKPPQPEFSAPTKKPSQPEFPDPKKPPQPEFPAPAKKLPQPEFPEPPRKLSQPEFTEPPRKLPQLEFPDPKKPPQPEFSDPPRKPPQPEFPVPPKKPLQPLTPRKPSQPEFIDSPRKSPQPEFPDPSGKPKFPETEPPTPEVRELSKQFEKPLQSPRKAPLQPGLGPTVRPRKQLMSEPTEDTLWAEAGTPPRKSSQPAISNPPPHSPKSPQPETGTHPQKPPLTRVGHLPRTTSEPHVGGALPRKPQQLPFQAVPRMPPEPAAGSLPRTVSEPEFQLLPGKPPQLQPHARLQKHPPAEHPRKPRLPASVSESSLPSLTGGLGPQFPPGLGAGRWRPRALAARGSQLCLQGSVPPQRRPLPSISSLGPPPVKPPLPPGPRNIQSYRSLMGAASAVRRTRSAAGTLCQTRLPRQPRPDPDDIYELYDDVEPQEEPSPRPKAVEKTSSMGQLPRRPLQEPELRKEKVQPPPLPPADLKSQKQMRKAEKAEREFRKKFKFEGEIVIQTRMMIDPNAKTRRGGGKHLGIRRGEILEVIEFTSKEEMLCRDAKGKYGYVPRTALLPLETEVYDDVGFWDPMENQPIPRGR